MQQSSKKSENNSDPKSQVMIIQKPICPICGNETEQLTFRLRSFWNDGTDVDLQPVNFQWKVKGMEDFHPPLYDMWTCKKCHFTSDNKNFAEPSRKLPIADNIFLQTLRKKFKNETVQNVLKTLGRKINFEEMDFYQAMRLHLLAIFILKLIPTIVDKESLRLGKYSMRLAWLFRDLQGRDEQEECLQKLGEVITEVKAVWKDMPGNEKEAMDQAIGYYECALSFSEQVDGPIMEVNLNKLLARIQLKLGDLKKARTYLKTAVNDGNTEKVKIDQLLASTLSDEKKLSNEDRKPMVATSRNLARLIDEANQLLQEVNTEIEKEQRPLAEKIIQKMAGHPAEDIRNELSRQNIDKRLIMKLVPVEKKKKKGFFGSLFGS